MPDKIDVKLDELNVGDVYFAQELRRVVKVVEHTTVETRARRQEAGGAVWVAENRKAVKLIGTIPTFPISGFVSERDAVIGQSVRDALSKSASEMQNPDTVWEEIWTDRVVPGRDTSPGKAAKLLDDKPALNFLQVYCVSTTRASKRERTSPIAMKPIGPIKFIPAGDVPEGLFMTDQEFRDANLAAEIEVPPEELPHQFMKLKAIAKNRGLDIEEVPPGENRVDRIIEFIRDAGKQKARDALAKSINEKEALTARAKPVAAQDNQDGR